MLVLQPSRKPERDITDRRGTDPVPRASRVIGVDVARGTALLGMMAVHVFDITDDQGAPTPTGVIAGGRSAATFVLIAGVSLAFLSGGRQVVRGRARTAVAGGLVVRALLIGAIGLALGALAEFNDVEGILPFYALLFLLAVPLLGWPPLVLAGAAAGVIVAGPVLLLAAAEAPLPHADSDPTFATLLQDPLGVLVQLLVTGEYPVVVYLAYICAGLAIGRLDLTSRRVAWWLFGGGIALAVLARLASTLLLYPLGGLAVLISETSPGDTPAEAAQTLLWNPDSPTSWWYLALPAPHSQTTVDLVHTLGSAVAVLGAALLLTRLPLLARLLSPLAAAGSMALTLYAAHLVLLATGVLQDEPAVLYALMVVGAIAFALLWRRWLGRGPLERAVAVAAGATRRGLADRLTGPVAERRGGPARRRAGVRAVQFLVPVACAAALVAAFSAGARLGPEPEEVSTSATGAGEAPPVATAPTPDSPPGPAVEEGTAPDLDRYCRLSEQIDEVDTRHPDDPKAFVSEARPLLIDMSRVAPVEIRDAVATSVAGVLAEAGEPQVQAPDEAAWDQAEERIDAYVEEYCP
jgi:uncharacterized membrane protein YeiB